MPLLILLLGILLLILLTVFAKINTFLSFLLVCIGIGLANGMSVAAITVSIQSGIGEMLGSLLLIIVLGAMVGKLIAEYGAAQCILSTLIKWFGRKYLMWALVFTAFIVGLPLYYGIGFVLLVPLIISLSYKYNIPAVYIGLPMLTSLSVTHGYLPPHPSPAALVQQYHADLGLTLVYGLVVAIPCIIIAGPLFATTLKNYTKKPLVTFAGETIPDEELPGVADSFIVALLPVFIIGISTLVKFLPHQGSVTSRIFSALGDTTMALIITLCYAIYALVLKKRKSMERCMFAIGQAAKDISPILLIIAGAGALKQVLLNTGTADNVSAMIKDLHFHPLFAAWFIAAAIRICLGSSTVAGLTAAGMIAPLIASSNISPSLFVLATGAGSLMFSHINDSGFWLFKEYFNLTIKETLKTWSVMESIISVVGLLMVFILYWLCP